MVQVIMPRTAEMFEQYVLPGLSSGKLTISLTKAGRGFQNLLNLNVIMLITMADEFAKRKSNLESCQRMMLLAEYRFEEGDLHQAISVLNEVLLSIRQINIIDQKNQESVNTLKTKIFLMLATSYDRLKKAELAVKYSESVLSLQPGNSEALKIREKLASQIPTPLASRKVDP